MELAEYEALSAAQDHLCAICRCGNGNRLLVVDHCHRAGAVRKLLCYKCNCGLGQFRDDPGLLRAASTYLEQFGAVSVFEPANQNNGDSEVIEDEWKRRAFGTVIEGGPTVKIRWYDPGSGRRCQRSGFLSRRQAELALNDIWRRHRAAIALGRVAT